MLLCGSLALFSIPLTADVVFMLVLDWVIDCFFVLEAFRQVRTGINEDGLVVWDRKKIWERYVRGGWLALDVITCLPLDFIQLGLGRVEPAVRVAKILRLLHVLRHDRMVEDGSTVSLPFRLLKLFFYTFIIAHFLGCLKYWTMLADPPHTAYRIELAARTQFGRYLQAMYWSCGSVRQQKDTLRSDRRHAAHASAAPRPAGL